MSFFSTVGSLFGWFQEEPQPPTDYTPSYQDVCQARAILQFLKLPTELVLQIIDHAQYWPRQTFATSPDRPRIAAVHHGPRASHAALCLDVGLFDNATVHPMLKAREIPKIKSLEFTVVSRDQGWTSERTQGTFNTSSWVEASILRRVHGTDIRSPCPQFANASPHDPSDFHKSVVDQGWFLVKRPESAKQGPQDGEGDFAWYLQGNRVAAGREEYHIFWADDGSEGNTGAGKGEGFLDELQYGDRILVWARAKVRSNQLRAILTM
ncbi:hypothetical protein EK21DRAFT_104260 [Setomelanomma holmii]|uniref:Uncharacterized protein n=1 Tax=Setomelanomma holmii TaxID=210430 RepID=A0A9P4LHC5_9PLEO|nr:hypothetical protein EK21DRAFT_104260 [Setomelanomma holmii]